MGGCYSSPRTSSHHAHNHPKSSHPEATASAPISSDPLISKRQPVTRHVFFSGGGPATLEDSTDTTIGIFPASSNQGIRTIQALLSSEHRLQVKKIVAIVHKQESSDMLLSLLGGQSLNRTSGIEIVSNVDMLDPEACAIAFQGLDRLFLVAPGIKDRKHAVSEALRSAKAQGVKSVVLGSVLGAQGEDTMFRKEFRDMERVGEELGFDQWTHLRCATLMDNYLMGASSILSARQFFGSHGTGKFALVAVEDVGRVAANVLMNPKEFAGRALDLTGPTSLNGDECAGVLSRTFGVDIKYKDVSSFAMLETLLGGGMDRWLADGLIETFEGIKTGKVEEIVSGDILRITQKQTSFEDFCRDHKAEFCGAKSPLLCVLPGTGNVGGQTTASLARLARSCAWPEASPGNPNIRVVARDMKDPELANLPRTFTVVEGDVMDVASVDAALKGVSRVLFVVPTIENRMPIAHQVLAAIKRANVEHIVLMSVLAAHTEAIDAMRQFRGLEKAMECLGDGMKWTCVRVGHFCDNLLVVAKDVIEKGELNGAMGDGKVAFLDVQDVGDAMTTILREGPALHHGRVYELTGPQALSMSDCAKIMTKVLGKPIKYVDSTPEAYGSALVASQRAPAWFVHDVLQDTCTAFRAGKGDVVCRDLLPLIGKQTTFQEWMEKNKSAFSS